MHTEQELRDALLLRAVPTSNVDETLDRFHLPAPTPRPTSRAPKALVGAGVGLALALTVVIVAPLLTSETTPEPAAGRVQGNWAMTSQLTPPSGWSLAGREISGDAESTTIADWTGKGFCTFSLRGPGASPRPMPTETEPVTVKGQPGSYAGFPGKEFDLFWRPDATLTASIACDPGPNGLGAARTPQQIREYILGLADSVTFGFYPMQLPVRVGQLPAGYVVGSLTERDTAAGWQITLRPEHDNPETPVITISPSTGDVGETNTRVGVYPATFLTTPTNRRGSRGPGPAVISTTSLWVPGAPVPICISANNSGTDDPESRRDPFLQLAESITYAPDPTDPSTWFDARDALPA